MDNYSISSFPNQEAESACLIKLKGELSIQNIFAIKKRLDSEINKYKDIVIEICEVSIIDLSILQFLLSLKKSEKLLEKSFTIEFNMDEDNTELLEHAGFRNMDELKFK